MSFFIPSLKCSWLDTSGLRPYWELLKPRVMMLVVFSGAVGLFIAPGYLHPFLCFVAILCIALGGGGAGAINMWYDRDIDAIMKRTKGRPIPSGRIDATVALIFGCVVSFISVAVMAWVVNFVAASVLFLSILFYVFVYTIWLKRRTVHNIVIGGLVGSFPPIIGWSAVTGDIGLDAILLGGIIFLWNPPHFWALSLFCADDYKVANIPMMPVVYGEIATKINILFYSLSMIMMTILFYFVSNYGYFYLVPISILNLFFSFRVLMVLCTRDVLQYRKLFLYSINYLFLLLFVVWFSKLLA